MFSFESVQYNPHDLNSTSNNMTYYIFYIIFHLYCYSVDEDYLFTDLY